MWRTTDGNSGFYRRMVGPDGGWDGIAASKAPMTIVVDYIPQRTRQGDNSAPNVHVEWKIPAALTNQNGVIGSLAGPMHQDTSNFESFVMTDAGTLDFSATQPSNLGVALRASTVCRCVYVWGLQGANKGGESNIIIGRPAYSIVAHGSDHKTGSNTPTTLNSLSIGFADINFTWVGNTEVSGAVVDATGALVAPQPILSDSHVYRAFFFSDALPTHQLEAMAQGLNPFELDGYYPHEAYLMEDPWETNPMCAVTGNKLTQYGTGMQFVSDGGLTAMVDRPSIVSARKPMNGMQRRSMLTFGAVANQIATGARSQQMMLGVG